MNTINDLTRIIHNRLRHLDGEWFENPKAIDIGVMLGFTDKAPTKVNEVEGTILDPGHPFWEGYIRCIDIWDDAEEEIEVAIGMLKDEGSFTVTKDGDDGPGVYVQVLDRRTENNMSLPNEYTVEFEPRGPSGNLSLKVTGPSGIYRSTLYRE